MQNVSSFRHEFTCPVSPARMFQALFLDSHNLIPLLVPEAIKSIEFIEGDGGAGSIKQTTFIEGGQMKIVKHRIDDIDKENFTCRYSLIEGDILFDRLESAGYEVKFEASGDGGSICKISSAYQTKTAVQLNEKDMKMAKDKAMGLCKVIQDYLLANPNVYN